MGRTENENRELDMELERGESDDYSEEEEA